MSDLISRHLVKAIADMAIFLEFTDEALLDADASIEAMEQLAAELQRMDDKGRSSLARQLKELSVEYGEVSRVRFVETLPESFGLE
jgi:hypothetical protein